MNKLNQGQWLGVLLALALCVSGAAQAQTTQSTDVRNFEVISIDGNNLVVRDQHGTHEYTVKPDFRFTVDGKSMAVGDLRPGMKGTATITKTTTVRPVYVTTVKMGSVVSQTGRSVTVKEEDGKIHRFTQSEADERGVRLYMDDKPVRIFDLNPGDQLTATIVSSGPPEILTTQDVDATLAAVAASAEATADASADTAASVPAAAATGQAEPSAAEAVTAAAPTPEPDMESGNIWLWVLLLIVLALMVWMFVRKDRKDVKVVKK